ncbi:MAG TPA: LicD family protein [Candidatus Blautia faecipullorum]|nr:LicD family protein [Candidatus Blautia faecipullorum]
MIPLKIELPEGFLDEEVRCGYTVTKQMKEVWAVELDLAVQLLDVCKRHNIQVFAEAGTLLGAARHKGFIPWDDDMDFCMMRSEYDKFCKIAPAEFKEPYFFQTGYTEPECMRGHAQLRNSMTTGIIKVEAGMHDFNQGIFIDIFPLDELYDDNKGFKQQKKRADHAQDMFQRINDYLYTKHKKNFLKLVYCKIADMMCSRADWFNKYEQSLQEANGKGNERVSLLCLMPVALKYARIKTAYDKVEMLPFENLTFPAPAGYESVLADLYGDWHKFVKGSSVHGGVYYDTSNSYKKYLSGELEIKSFDK